MFIKGKEKFKKKHVFLPTSSPTFPVEYNNSLICHVQQSYRIFFFHGETSTFSAQPTSLQAVLHIQLVVARVTDFQASMLNGLFFVNFTVKDFLLSLRRVFHFRMGVISKNHCSKQNEHL